MKRGLYISGIGHGLLIFWLLFGGLFTGRRDEPPVPVTDVSIVSAEEFAAMTAPREGAPEVTPEAEPEAPPPRPEPEPAPEPAPEPEPEPAPEPEPPTAPQPEPPAPEPATPIEAPPAEESTPPEAPRVADEVIVPPDEPAPVAPEAVEATEPSDTPSEVPVDEQDVAQPEAQTTEIVTEAETPSSAPETSRRPRARPARPDPVETAAPATEPEPAPENAPDPVQDAVNDAVNDALEEALDAPEPGSAQSDAPLGPPLTSGERDGLRVAVSQCWNLGSTSTDAMATTVVVMVQMTPDGRPKPGIKLVRSDGPNQNAIDTAFDAARRAIIRCGANGYNLPSEKYEQWREIEMTFNPANMRLR